jgi:uncharacterized membrane protein
MNDTLSKIVAGAAIAIGTYFIVDPIIEWWTGKRIHRHAYNYLQSQLPQLVETIKMWQKKTEWMSIQLKLRVDDMKVNTRKLLKVIGILKDPTKQPSIITEQYITHEQVVDLGFDLSINETQTIELFS